MKNVFFSTILKMIPIILLVLLGFIIKKLKFVTKNSIEDIKKLVLNIALPCLIYTAFYKLNLEKKFLVIILTISIINILMLFIGKLIGKAFNIQNPYFPLLFSTFEAGMMGYSMFTAVYGDNELGKFAIMDLGQTFFVFFIWMPLLMSKSNKKKILRIY
ncbi:AEC family transporter [Clostridium sp.]|jgi:malate permease and related proteins|uniref:AEC family transporter n=1 Tax=Clostridium sp. TaxID=1506 RepID=UPI0039F61FED